MEEPVKAKDVVGRKIVAVRQSRHKNRGKSIWHFESLLLDDGTVLKIETVEGENDYFHRLDVYKRDE